MADYDPSQRHWGFSNRAPSLREAAWAAARGSPSPVPAALNSSCTFACPGAPSAMAAAYGMPALTGLAATRRAGGDPDPAALDALRSKLRASLDAAWAVDAVGRGDVAAGNGDAVGAAALYREALELDAGCCGAFAGRAYLAERDRRLHDALEGYRAAAAAGWPGGASAAARVAARLTSLGIPSDRASILTERVVGVDAGKKRRSRSRSPGGASRRRRKKKGGRD